MLAKKTSDYINNPGSSPDIQETIGKRRNHPQEAANGLNAHP